MNKVIAYIPIILLSKFESDYYEVSNSTLMAQAILLATFQKIVKLGPEKLEFHYILNKNIRI